MNGFCGVFAQGSRSSASSFFPSCQTADILPTNKHLSGALLFKVLEGLPPRLLHLQEIGGGQDRWGTQGA